MKKNWNCQKKKHSLEKMHKKGSMPKQMEGERSFLLSVELPVQQVEL